MILRRLALTATALLWSILGSACGESALNLTASKTAISAGGFESTTISASVIVDDEPRANARITFETSAGTFVRAGELQSTEAATGSDGSAKVELYSAAQPGPATVTAHYYDDAAGLDLSATIAITFTTAAAAVVDGRIRFTCATSNIGALRDPLPDIKVRCTLNAQTRDGQTIGAAALQPSFRTEAGAITPLVDDSSGELVFIYSPKGGNTTPRDVPPDPSTGEPSYNDLNGIQRNPRDGLVTLVAIVEGEEAYEDLNGNGRYDAGEPFTDTAEPWVDSDDDDGWATGEEFIDSNGNGRWDAGNGKWDSRTKLMAIYKILWTGKVDNTPSTSRIESFGTDIYDGGRIELRAQVLDANINPIATFPAASDALEWVLVGDEATTYDDTSVPVDNVYGFSFDKAANTERKRWRILSNTFTPRVMTLTVEDGSPQDGTLAKTPWTVTVKLHASPGPDGSGGYLAQRSETVGQKVVGTCD